MASRKPGPAVESLTGLPADEVIAVLAEHWLDLSQRERDEYTHALLEHPDRVAIFADIFRRAAALRDRAQN